MYVRSLQLSVIVLIAGAVLSACATQTKPTVQEQTPATVNAQAGVENRLKQGQILAIELPSNASTGYGWEILEDGSPQLRPAPVPTTGNAPATPPMPGAGGTSRWRFLAVQSGSTNLRLVYRRSWEKDVAPASTATYRIVVE